MKLFSDACEYGLRATLWLGQRPDELHKVREIAEGTCASPGYLVKVLQRLSKAGILTAQRGSHGGFAIKQSPGSVTVLDVINAVDPLERIDRCPLDIDAHGINLCPLHRRIDDAMALIEDSFENVSIADLLEETTSSKPLCDGLVLGISATPKSDD